MVRLFFLSALSLALNFLLWLGHWTGVEEVPHLLKGWFEVHPFYIDSLLKTFCDASTPDPFVAATLEIVLKSDRWPLNFDTLHENYLLLLTVWPSFYQEMLLRRRVPVTLTSALIVFSNRLFTYLLNIPPCMTSFAMLGEAVASRR